ncbi:MAG TPA: SPFH domain-containing protein [Thermomicrobiales bacterium]|nr:SPFH domain-containing protein [Thermomicrobiales bacterium]
MNDWLRQQRDNITDINSSSRKRSSGGRGGGGASTAALVVGLIVVLLIAGVASAVRVDAGEACVVRTNGRITDTATPGFEWRIPGIQKFSCYPTRVQNLEVGGLGSSRANFVDSAITAKSKDGVSMEVTAIVYFTLPVDNLQTIYLETGRSAGEVNDRLVQVQARNQTRAVIEQSNVDDIYLGGMDATSRTIEERLRPVLEERGITLESFALTSVDPSDEYKSAIQAQVEQQQEAQRQAEVVKVREQEAEQKRVQAQGDADAAIIAAEGEAEANRIITESLTPEILQMRYYEALESVNWAIFAPEDVQPMLPIETPEATVEPTPDSTPVP